MKKILSTFLLSAMLVLVLGGCIVGSQGDVERLERRVESLTNEVRLLHTCSMRDSEDCDLYWRFEGGRYAYEKVSPYRSAVAYNAWKESDYVEIEWTNSDWVDTQDMHSLYEDDETIREFFERQADPNQTDHVMIHPGLSPLEDLKRFVHQVTQITDGMSFSPETWKRIYYMDGDDEIYETHHHTSPCYEEARVGLPYPLSCQLPPKGTRAQATKEELMDEYYQ